MRHDRFAHLRPAIAPRRRPLAAFAGLLLLVAGNVAAQNTVLCESQDGRYQSCPASTSGGVWLSRQLSRQGCWQNDTWGYDRNRIWVTRGCRAEFRVGATRNDHSDRAKIAGAVILGTIAAAAIANRHHDDDRDDKRDRYDRDDYRHDYGGDYDYGYGDGSYGGGRSGREFTCASRDGRMAWCGQQIGRRDHVEVRRQLSDSPCSYGRSWGVENGRIWVDDGCRAVFVVY